MHLKCPCGSLYTIRIRNNMTKEFHLFCLSCCRKFRLSYEFLDDNEGATIQIDPNMASIWCPNCLLEIIYPIGFIQPGIHCPDCGCNLDGVEHEPTQMIVKKQWE